MSVSWGTKYDKLKTNLRLAVNRLRLLQKKKTEMALKSRTEIADFLGSKYYKFITNANISIYSDDKEDRARIKVESIIREDFVVEAYGKKTNNSVPKSIIYIQSYWRCSVNSF